jgi:hypothetical protein
MINIEICTHIWISQHSRIQDNIVNLEVGYRGQLRDEFLQPSVNVPMTHTRKDQIIQQCSPHSIYQQYTSDTFHGRFRPVPTAHLHGRQRAPARWLLCARVSAAAGVQIRARCHDSRLQSARWCSPDRRTECRVSDSSVLRRAASDRGCRGWDEMDRGWRYLRCCRVMY